MPSVLTLEFSGRSWPLQHGDLIGRFGTVAQETLKSQDLLSRHHFRVDHLHGAWQLTLLPTVSNPTRLNGKLLQPGQSIPLLPVNDLTIHTLHLRLRQASAILQEGSFSQDRLNRLLAHPALPAGDLPVFLPLLAQTACEWLPQTTLVLCLTSPTSSHCQPAVSTGPQRLNQLTPLSDPALLQLPDTHHRSQHPCPGGLLLLFRHIPEPWSTAEHASIATLNALFAQALANAQRQTQFERLQSRETELKTGLAHAARYVSRLLPPPLASGPVHIERHHQPCGDLGGDVFGHGWLDADHLYLFIVDVAGHGIGSALLAVSIINHLHLSIERKEPWLSDPAAWLHQLNETFPMEKHGGLTWTLWCGLYHHPSRHLTYASAGHPPAILLSRGQAHALELTTQGPVMGVLSDVPFQSRKTPVRPGAKLFLYTDGVYEFPLADGSAGSNASFIRTLTTTATMTSGECAFLHQHAAALCGSSTFPDDFTLLCVKFL